MSAIASITSPCVDPRGARDWCPRSAACYGECMYAIECKEETRQTVADPELLATWSYKNNDETSETLVSPCGRYQVIRIRTPTGRRYSAWDIYPDDGTWLPVCKAVESTADRALGALL